MLILVGVTVTVSLNGGLFDKAREASKGTEIKREKEQLTAAIVTVYDETTEKIDKDRFKEILGEEWKVNGKDGGPYTVISANQNTYKILQDGTIEEKKTIQTGTKLADIYCANEECTEETHLHQGDYVEYIPDTTVTTYYPDGEKTENIGEKTGYTTSAGATELQTVKQEKLNWRVLGKNEKGELLLISETPTSDFVRFKGYIGHNNFENVLNNTCETLYSNTELGVIARSITMDDIDTYLDGNNYDKTTYGGGSSNPGGYGYTNTISSKYDYDEVNNKLTKLDEEKNLTLTSNRYSYVASDYITDSIKLDLLLGANKFYYWIVCQTVWVTSNKIAWGCGYAFYGNIIAAGSFGNTVDDRYDATIGARVRPVLSLPTATTIDQIGKIY